jgi:alpha-amylase
VACGRQIGDLDHWNRIGWTRLGDAAHPKAMVVLMGDGQEGTTWVNVERPNAVFVAVAGHIREPVRTREQGWGEFRCNGGSESVYVQR